VAEATSEDDASIIGEECHIVSERRGGPRYQTGFPAERLDAIDNLILLCRIHHKVVDDQCATYPREHLESMKARHEQRVASALQAVGKLGTPSLRRRVKNRVGLLLGLESGQSIVSIIAGACTLDFGYEEPSSESEIELIASLHQEVQDLGDLWADLEGGERVRARYRLTQLLEDLHSTGLWVFGEREEQELVGPDGSAYPFPMAIVRVVRSDSPEVRVVDLRKAGKPT